MKERNEFRNLVEEIVNSYEIKAKSVTSLIRQTVKKINNFRQEEVQIAEKLKETLAKKRSLRRKDFDTMIADIRDQQAKKEKEITHMVENFCEEEEETVAQLRGILSGESLCTLDDFQILKKRMLRRPNGKERRLTLMLKNFHRDQEELTAAFRKLLEKGSQVKIKDFKAMIKAFHIEHQDEVSEVDEMLEEFERVKDEISNKWQKVLVTVNKGEYRAPLAEP